MDQCLCVCVCVCVITCICLWRSLNIDVWMKNSVNVWQCKCQVVLICKSTNVFVWEKECYICVCVSVLYVLCIYICYKYFLLWIMFIYHVHWRVYIHQLYTQFLDNGEVNIFIFDPSYIISRRSIVTLLYYTIPLFCANIQWW